jgi:hypothetical protein
MPRTCEIADPNRFTTYSISRFLSSYLLGGLSCNQSVAYKKHLQDPTMNVQDAAADLVGLKDIISSRGKQVCLDAMQAMKRCEDWNVEINHRTRRKKKMPGEQASDSRLNAKEETARIMRAALGTIMNSMDQWRI